MIKKILIMGGYGNAGSQIAELLLRHSRTKVILAGRDKIRAENLAAKLNQKYNTQRASAAVVDARNFEQMVEAMHPCDLVIVSASVIDKIENVALAAIKAKVHYFDILLSFEKKLQTLKTLEPELKKQKLIFITDGGFHPGLPAAMARYANEYFDELHVAQFFSLLRVDWRDFQFSPSTIDEMIEEFKNFEPWIYQNGKWRNPGWSFNLRADFGENFEKVKCYPMHLHELITMTRDIPSLIETGFYVSGFNWVTDNFVLPLLMIGIKLLPDDKIGFLKNLFVRSMKKFSREPFCTMLKMTATGLKNGKNASMTMEVSHEDGYFLTAAPVVATVLQLISGEISQPGFDFQGMVVEPKSFFTDLQKLGIAVHTEFHD